MNSQIQELQQMLQLNQELQIVLQKAEEMGLPNWYVGAGGVAQTVWNIKHGFSPKNEIKDYDLVYFDPNTSYEAEDIFIQRGKELFKDISTLVEIRNQARVHLWYEKHFGYPIKAHNSVEAAIDTWPTTATTVAVRKNGDTLKVYSTYGLDDLLNLTVRANKIKITEKIYQDKVDRWTKVWPNLTVIPWEEN